MSFKKYCTYCNAVNTITSTTCHNCGKIFEWDRNVLIIPDTSSGINARWIEKDSLEDELIRTQQKLEIAMQCLTWAASQSNVVGEMAKKALRDIGEIE